MANILTPGCRKRWVSEGVNWLCFEGAVWTQGDYSLGSWWYHCETFEGCIQVSYIQGLRSSGLISRSLTTREFTTKRSYNQGSHFQVFYIQRSYIQESYMKGSYIKEVLQGSLQGLIGCLWFSHTTPLTPKSNGFYYRSFAFYQRMSKVNAPCHNNLLWRTSATSV